MPPTNEPDGISEPSLEANSSLMERRQLERVQWEQEWGPLRRLDLKIQGVIQRKHCKKYCGLIPQNHQDYIDCFKHHSELYKRYLKAIGKESLAKTIGENFRADKEQL